MRKEEPQILEPGEPKVMKVGPNFYISGILPDLKEFVPVSKEANDQAYQVFQRAVKVLEKCELSLNDVLRIVAVVQDTKVGDAVRNRYEFFFRDIKIKPAVIIFLSGENNPFGPLVRMEIEAYQQD